MLRLVEGTCLMRVPCFMEIRTTFGKSICKKNIVSYVHRKYGVVSHIFTHENEVIIEQYCTYVRKFDMNVNLLWGISCTYVRTYVAKTFNYVNSITYSRKHMHATTHLILDISYIVQEKQMIPQIIRNNIAHKITSYYQLTLLCS